MRKHLIASTAAAAALLLMVPTPASAGTATPTATVMSSDFAAPFNLAVSGGRVYVADGGLNTVSRLRKNGSVKTVVADAPGAAGVALSKNRRYLAYTTTEFAQGGPPGPPEPIASALHIWGPRGKRVVADTFAFEQANNPDQKLTYGVDDPSQCVTDALSPIIGVKYTGAVDSHAYSVAAYGNKWVVADAGGNDLLLVDKKGNVSLIAVMPRQPLKLTAAMAAAYGLPDCVVGVTYSFESVPTDVEVGKDGWLYVTTLPGGPEDESLGARGRVYRVNPRTGEKQVVARGFLGATNLALGKHGEIYVAELFAGRISVVRNGKVSPYLDLPGAVSVETGKDGTLWASTLDFGGGPGTIVKIGKGKNSTP